MSGGPDQRWAARAQVLPKVGENNEQVRHADDTVAIELSGQPDPVAAFEKEASHRRWASTSRERRKGNAWDCWMIVIPNQPEIQLYLLHQPTAFVRAFQR